MSDAAGVRHGTVHVWSDDQKTTLIENGQTFALSDLTEDGGTLRALWVEGVEASGGLRDVVFTLQYPADEPITEDVVKFTVVGVNVLQDGEDITGSTRTEIVGKRINLAAQVLPQAVTVNAHQWQIPGEKVDDFVVSPDFTSGHKVTFNEGDLQKDSLDFCWVDGADGRVVRDQVHTQYGNFTGQATFDVKRPVVSPTVELGGVGISEDEPAYYLALRFGQPKPHVPGFKMNCAVQIPQGFGGETCFAQIYRRCQTWDGGSPHIEQGIDPMRNPGEPPTHWQYAWLEGLRVDYVEDYPAYELTWPHSGLEVRDGSQAAKGPIRMWYMYNPTTPDSIWVPLLVVDWHWSGKAHSDGGTWLLDLLDPPDPPGAATVNPTNEFPDWDRIIPE